MLKIQYENGDIPQAMTNWHKYADFSYAEQAVK